MVFVRLKGVVVLKEETKGILRWFSVNSKGEKVRRKKRRKNKVISEKSVKQRNKAEVMASLLSLIHRFLSIRGEGKSVTR